MPPPLSTVPLLQVEIPPVDTDSLPRGVWRRLGKRALYIFLRSDLSYIEILMGVWYMSFVNALWFGDPHLLQRNPTYAPMALLAPQWVWGLAFFTTGALKVLGCLSYNVLIKSRERRAIELVRFTGAFFGTILWSIFTTVLVLSSPQAPGLIGYAFFAVTCFLTALRHVSWLIDLLDFIAWKRVGRRP